MLVRDRHEQKGSDLQPDDESVLRLMMALERTSLPLTRLLLLETVDDTLDWRECLLPPSVNDATGALPAAVEALGVDAGAGGVLADDGRKLDCDALRLLASSELLSGLLRNSKSSSSRSRFGLPPPLATVVTVVPLVVVNGGRLNCDV